MKSLLDVRKAQKSKKPTFTRQDSHKKARVGTAYRRSRGLQSKVRLNKRGYRIAISNGWKSPRAVRGQSSTGLEQMRVHSIAELAAIQPATQGIIIARVVGTKNLIEIIKKAQELKITLLNIKDPAKKLQEIEDARKKKSAKKKQQVQEKKDKDKEKKKKAEEKKDKLAQKVEEESKKTDEEKKIEEKKEKDKILTTTEV